MLIVKSKRKKTRIKLIITAVLLIAGAAVAVFINIQQRGMNAMETGEFLPGVYALNNGFVNCFLIKNGDKYIAVDAGSGANDVQKELDKLGVSAGEITAVLMTHTHGDHTGALKLFNGAVIYGVNPNIAGRVIADGEEFNIDGTEVKVIAAPGHADDSVCYLINGKYLFTGDNLSLNGDTVGMFNSVYNKSDEQQKLDIKKLSSINGVEYLITSHYGYTANPKFPAY